MNADSFGLHSNCRRVAVNLIKSMSKTEKSLTAHKQTSEMLDATWFRIDEKL